MLENTENKVVRSLSKICIIACGIRIYLYYAQTNQPTTFQPRKNATFLVAKLYIENNIWVRGNARLILSVEHDISRVSATNE